MDSLFGFFIWRPFLALMGWILSAAAVRFEIIEVTINYFIYYSDKHAVPQFTAFLLIVLAHLVAPALIEFFHTEKPSWINSAGRTVSGRIESIQFSLNESNSASFRIRAVRKTLLTLFPAFFAAISISAARKVDLRIRSSFCVIYLLSQAVSLVLSPLPFSRHAIYVLHHVALGSLLGLLCFSLLPHLAARYMEVGFHALVQLHLTKQWFYQTWDKWNFWSPAHEEF